MEKHSKFRYIYNYKQASFYLSQQCNLVLTDKHEVTGNRYYMFVKNERLRQAEEAWRNRKVN
ncbi:hypothetical protein [Clostridium sp. DJ247]|uniref:hypothetical protein n=1 Tax=Clostridium sp. DJ247 TaxID=2726188 RepID=UPI00162A9F81|nr:hypothetical protein [Clostridium sp. DJ247]MBC2580846.1 hypothetical protein [Clostridium sp. DJ247]